MLNASALRFLAFIPKCNRQGFDGGTREDEVQRLARKVARHDPQLVPVRDAIGLSLWTAAAPVDIPVDAAPDGSSYSVGWRFRNSRTTSIDRNWGGFVTLTKHSECRWSISRSVDGLMPASVFRTDAGLVVASQVPEWLLRTFGLKPKVDWSVIAALLHDPTVTAYRSALSGIVTIPPGCSFEPVTPYAVAVDGDVRADPPIETRWNPCDLARAAHGTSAAAAEQRLREAVDETVGAWAGVGDRAALELSGGLDSAILSGTLSRIEPRHPMTLVNASTIQAGGDERRYARDVSRLCDIPLIEIAADERVLDIVSLRNMVHPSEPILYGLDVGHDAQMSLHAREVGADTIFTGQGGDAVFYQMPDVEIAADSFRLNGPRAIWSGHTRDIARRAQRSVWSAWGAILADRLGRPAMPARFPGSMATPESIERSANCVHPWLADVAGLPPAKVRQIQAIANSQIFYGPTLRGKSTLFVHPLMSQPVVEACLSIPIPILTGGRLDRQLARAAFADRLPTSVAQRRSKGEATSYYNLAVTAAVSDLRALLLDGRLVERGLLDRRILEQALDADTLLWSDVSRPLMLYASIEAWIGYWERL
ncbi:asparagine synthase-related protein [Sphingomonas faeni]|uniref:asparagine synthase-related protein n=1 Tax=Sphingomonas faeni TaxID=185950 RepID=UPI00278A5FB1|nr:asparagine synthase-related protein [Sphingomonas faeni]MDQ0839261.1 asparagine synthase (glutamine-hydrolyzing) [Sphingomonas faeni]